MDHSEMIAFLKEMTPDELFYKEYYQACQRGEKQEFLAVLDPRMVRERKLVVPEMYDDAPIDLQDERFFDKHSKASVHLVKHNRYTPEFVHTHVFFEIIYVLSGSAVHNIDGQRSVLKQGDLCMISPAVSHSIFVDNEETLVINILMRRETIEDIFYNVLRDENIISSFLLNGLYVKEHIDYLLFHTAGDDEIQNEILDMYTEQLRKDKYFDRIVSSMLIVFYTKLARKYENSVELPATTDPCLAERSEIFRYALDNLQTASLSSLAEHLGYSVTYCSRLVHKVTGCKYSDFIRDLRFQKAESMLKHTNFSIHAISEQLGYENPENFMRAFKKAYGMTPSEYRTL